MSTLPLQTYLATQEAGKGKSVLPLYMGFLSTSAWSFCSSTVGDLASPVHHSSTSGTAPFHWSSSFTPCPFNACNSFWASRHDKGICQGFAVSKLWSRYSFELYNIRGSSKGFFAPKTGGVTQRWIICTDGILTSPEFPSLESLFASPGKEANPLLRTSPTIQLIRLTAPL